MRLLDKLARREADIASRPPVTLVAFGDSVTQGCFELLPGEGDAFTEVYDYEAVYHARLRRMLEHVFPRAPITVVNAGIAGQSAAAGLQRLERDVLARQPDLAIVCFGLNDACAGLEALSAYTGALRDIFAALQQRSIETVFLTPNMMNTYVSPLTVPESVIPIARRTAEIQCGGTMDAYADAARSLCGEMRVPVSDAYARWQALHRAGVDTTRLLANHINHPTRSMHGLFAALLFDAIVMDRRDG